MGHTAQMCRRANSNTLYTKDLIVLQTKGAMGSAEKKEIRTKNKVSDVKINTGNKNKLSDKTNILCVEVQLKLKTDIEYNIFLRKMSLFYHKNGSHLILKHTLHSMMVPKVN
jgi:hypothetical protein